MAHEYTVSTRKDSNLTLDQVKALMDALTPKWVKWLDQVRLQPTDWLPADMPACLIDLLPKRHGCSTAMGFGRVLDDYSEADIRLLGGCRYVLLIDRTTREQIRRDEPTLTDQELAAILAEQCTEQHEARQTTRTGDGFLAPGGAS